MAPDSIPGYDDLTPFGPGIVGTTIGPVSAHSQFDPTIFIDTMASHKHRAFELGWIKNHGIITSLDQKLDNAKAQLKKGIAASASNILRPLSAKSKR